MQIKELKHLAHQPGTEVSFIEPACGAMVIKVNYILGETPSSALLKTKQGEVITLKNLAQGYDLLRAVGLHKATLEQTIPHSELCIPDTAKQWTSNTDSRSAAIQLRF
ncbi:hypothetical protein [Neptunomonas phycophila]|uniref:hypothetical protein n=1 Tax=Neptunomonas phycophila TaxID=1572645 RepID=UPI000948BC30|nr:hypothetical protein [Neptunomonas phycophila]